MGVEAVDRLETSRINFLQTAWNNISIKINLDQYQLLLPRVKQTIAQRILLRGNVRSDTDFSPFWVR